jgi:hypothetical protein
MEMGGAGIKLIISLIIFGVAAQAAFVFIPIYVAVYDFTSKVDNLLQYGIGLELPIKDENLTVDRTRSKLTVKAEFTVPVKTLFYTYHWQVSTEKSYPLF